MNVAAWPSVRFGETGDTCDSRHDHLAGEPAEADVGEHPIADRSGTVERRPSREFDHPADDLHARHERHRRLDLVLALDDDPVDEVHAARATAIRRCPAASVGGLALDHAEILDRAERRTFDGGVHAAHGHLAAIVGSRRVRADSTIRGRPCSRRQADHRPALVVDDLVGTHVILERLRPDHVDAIAAAGSGDRSTFGLTGVPGGPSRGRGVRRAAPRRRRAAAGPPRSSSGGPPTESIVGCTRFMSPSWPLGRRDPDEVEVGGTWLAADAQRSPINTEAKLLLLTHAFDVWAVQRVAICTDARNDRSRRAIERLGATFEGVLRHHRASTAAGEAGTLRDTAVYSIIADDWPAVRAAARPVERRRSADRSRRTGRRRTSTRRR